MASAGREKSRGYCLLAFALETTSAALPLWEGLSNAWLSYSQSRLLVFECRRIPSYGQRTIAGIVRTEIRNEAHSGRLIGEASKLAMCRIHSIGKCPSITWSLRPHDRDRASTALN